MRKEWLLLLVASSITISAAQSASLCQVLVNPNLSSPDASRVPGWDSAVLRGSSCGMGVWMAEFEGQSSVARLDNSRPCQGIEQALPDGMVGVQRVKILARVSYSSLSGDGWYDGEAPIHLYLAFQVSPPLLFLFEVFAR